jgi:UDP-2,3-diacylglucosamine pyrophosphatase LpxH
MPEISPTASMKTKAKIVVSDLHLGEGRRNWDGSFNVFEDFTVDSKFVELLDFYSKAYDQVELVLNGNCFEMLRCRAVVDYPDILFETYAEELIRVALDGHPEVVAAMRRFMENPNHSMAYILGEADMGVLWPKVQQEIRSRISQRIVFYPNYYLDQGIYIQHGHQFEGMYDLDVNSPFKEVEGLNVLKLPWGAFFNAHFIQPLRRIRPQFYRVRPMRNYLMWAFLFETRFLLKVIIQFFRMLISASSRRLYPGNSWWTVFKIFSQAVDSGDLEEKAENLIASDTIQKVILGHTHIPNYRQFESGKEYFNSGTWTKNLSLDLRSLGSFHKLTYVLIEFRAPPVEPQAKLMEWHGKHEVIGDYI